MLYKLHHRRRRWQPVIEIVQDVVAQIVYKLHHGKIAICDSNRAIPVGGLNYVIARGKLERSVKLRSAGMNVDAGANNTTNACTIWLRTLRSHNLFQVDNIGMVQRFQNLDFSESRNGETIFFLFGVDPFECNYFIGLFVAGYKNASISSFPNFLLFLEYIDISHNSWGLDGKFGFYVLFLYWGWGWHRSIFALQRCRG